MTNLGTTVRRRLQKCTDNHHDSATPDTLAPAELFTKGGADESSKEASYFVDCYYQANHGSIRVVECIDEGLAVN